MDLCITRSGGMMEWRYERPLQAAAQTSSEDVHGC
jgi:hypothetical protein